MLEIIHPITGTKLQVASQDFSQKMNWEDAKRACSELGSGWRLPNIDELKSINEHLHKIGEGNFEIMSGIFSDTGVYWSSSENGPSLAWFFIFNKSGLDGAGSGGKKNKPCRVRAVRTL